MPRPIIRYRFRFDHPVYPSVTLEQQGETKCIAKGYAWHDFEQHLKTLTGAPMTDWRLGEQEPLQIVSNG